MSVLPANGGWLAFPRVTKTCGLACGYIGLINALPSRRRPRMVRPARGIVSRRFLMKPAAWKRDVHTSVDRGGCYCSKGLYSIPSRSDVHEMIRQIFAENVRPRFSPSKRTLASRGLEYAGILVLFFASIPALNFRRARQSVMQRLLGPGENKPSGPTEDSLAHYRKRHSTGSEKLRRYEFVCSVKSTNSVQ